jgi:hypothetical protein
MRVFIRFARQTRRISAGITCVFSFARQEGERDELEACGVVGRVDEEDLAGGLVLVKRDVLALDDGLLFPNGEELEVLDEPGLGRAHKGGEARDVRGAAVVEHALLEGEGGAHEDGLAGLGALPRGQGLVVLGDVEDVGLEAALVDVGRGREGADPVPVAEPVGGLLGFGVPARVFKFVRRLGW